ncbi:MAG: hypothetical protein NZO16_02365 [Deltaproteobacteria bacterium]|nr:hypothetical protein [Deltaproteobacteria bacterium]
MKRVLNHTEFCLEQNHRADAFLISTTLCRSSSYSSSETYLRYQEKQEDDKLQRQKNALQQLGLLLQDHIYSTTNPKKLPIIKYSDEQKNVLKKAASGVALSDSDLGTLRSALEKTFEVYSKLDSFSPEAVRQMVQLNKFAAEAKIYEHDLLEVNLDNLPAMKTLLNLMLEYAYDEKALRQIFSDPFIEPAERIYRINQCLRDIEKLSSQNLSDQEIEDLRFSLSRRLLEISQIVPNMASFFNKKLEEKNYQDSQLVRQTLQFYALSNVCFPLSSTSYRYLRYLAPSMDKLAKENN